MKIFEKEGSSYIEINLKDLIEKIKKEHGNKIELSKIKLNIEYKRFQGFLNTDNYGMSIESEEI